MKPFPTPTSEALAAFTADCPECEYCCAIGLCCPPFAQFMALVALMHRAAGSPLEECAKYANAIVAARVKANEKHGVQG